MTILLVVILILLAAALAPIAGVDSRERADGPTPELERRRYNPCAD